MSATRRVTIGAGDYERMRRSYGKSLRRGVLLPTRTRRAHVAPDRHSGDVFSLSRVAAMLCKPFILLGLLLLSRAVHAGAAVHVNISAIGGTQQTVVVNRQLPQRFVAAATFDDGTPVVGLNLRFGVNACMSSLPAPGAVSPCPDPAAYGHFLGSAVAATDAGGKAVSAPFVAGSAQGSYSVFVSRADWAQLINGQTLTDVPVAPSVSNLFQIVQAPAPAVTPTPALSAYALIVLAGLSCLAACRSLHARA